MNWLLTKIVYLIFGDVLHGAESSDIVLSTSLVVLVVPLIETFVFQFAIIRLLLLIKNTWKEIIAMVISATLFAFSHSYSTYYIAIGFIVGMIFAYFYIIGFNRFKCGFLVVFAMHSTMNAVVYFNLI